MTRAPQATLAGTPVLETERLVLRAPVAGDWPLWRDFMRADRSRHVRAAEMNDALAWRAFGHFIGHWVLRGFGSFVITDRETGAPLGSCGPWYPESWPEPEIGWTLWSDAAEGRGIAFEAAQAARGFAFDVLGWDTAVSYIDADNARSAALARRMGCLREAAPAQVMGHVVDVWRHPRPGVDGGVEAYA